MADPNFLSLSNLKANSEFTLANLNGTNGFAINGIDERDNLGTSVSAAGDINGDGIDDIIIGAPNASPNGILRAGQSYVIFGGANVSSDGTFNLSSLNGTNGFTLNGIAPNDNLGFSVSAAGDINGDGFDDIIIGAPNASPNGILNAGQSYIDSGNLNVGQSYVVFGGPTVGEGGTINLSSLNGTNGFTLNGIAFNDKSGFSVSAAGDINGDGFDDIIIGAPNASPGILNAGQSYVVFGGPTVGKDGTINLSSLDGTNGFALNGINFYDYSGTSVSAAGDINGDGFDDIIIGAPSSDTFSFYPSDDLINRTGQSYVVFGGATVGKGGTINLSSLDGTNGFTLNGIAGLDLSGTTVSKAGDINSDGFDDLIIGAPYANPKLITDAGQSYVVFGSATVGSGGTINLSSLDSTNGFTLDGIASGDLSGRSVSDAGDINGDGIDDLILGARTASYVVFGGATVGSGGTINGIAFDGFSGSSVSAAGDINGDGIDDIIIGAPNAYPNGILLAGQSYVIYGKRAPTLDLNTATPGTDFTTNFSGTLALVDTANPTVIA